MNRTSEGLHSMFELAYDKADGSNANCDFQADMVVVDICPAGVRESPGFWRAGERLGGSHCEPRFPGRPPDFALPVIGLWGWNDRSEAC